MKRFLIGTTIALGLVVTTIATSIDAYQVCSTAMQVTFKNGVNLVVDAECGISLWR